MHICAKEGKRKKSVYICDVCPNKPGLCKLCCFGKIHQDIK